FPYTTLFRSQHSAGADLPAAGAATHIGRPPDPQGADDRRALTAAAVSPGPGWCSCRFPPARRWGWWAAEWAWSAGRARPVPGSRSEEHTSELQSREKLVC